MTAKVLHLFLHAAVASFFTSNSPEYTSHSSCKLATLSVAAGAAKNTAIHYWIVRFTSMQKVTPVSLSAWPDVVFVRAAATAEEPPLPAYKTPLRPQQKGQEAFHSFRVNCSCAVMNGGPEYRVLLSAIQVPVGPAFRCCSDASGEWSRAAFRV